MHNIYFARHGETVWNVENKICGMTDSPLTEKGRQQARELGRKVRESGVRIDEILYSPLSRAADTAKAVAEATGLPARCEPRLREQCFGRYEGTPRDGAEFRTALHRFLCDEELRQELSQNAAETARQEFSSQAFAARVAAVYAQALGQTPLMRAA